MSLAKRLVVRLKQNKKAFAAAKAIRNTFLYAKVPPLPRILKPLLRGAYHCHYLVVVLCRAFLTVFYRNPLFQGRCDSFGRRVTMEGLPFVVGPVSIHVGDDVVLGGNLAILSGWVCEEAPRLVLKDRAGVGWNTIISLNREVIIEEDAIVSYDCRISDTDGHRKEADLRAAGVSPDPKDVHPVRICRSAWIGNGTHIMKGVTIGEGAIVAANSVVVTNIPPYSLALGNPAEVLRRNAGLPTTAVKPDLKPKGTTTP
jgi:acetyltransferase-like isoleucine patch superfamily enzyme